MEVFDELAKVFVRMNRGMFEGVILFLIALALHFVLYPMMKNRVEAKNTPPPIAAPAPTIITTTTGPVITDGQHNHVQIGASPPTPAATPPTTPPQKESDK